MKQTAHFGLHRRGLLSLVPGAVLAACSRPTQADGVYSVTNTFSEIAMAPDGSRCAVQPTSDSINSILLVRADLSEPMLLSFPDSQYWLRDIAFGDDADNLLFTAGPPQFGGFEANIRLFRLNVDTLRTEPVPTGYDYNRVPVFSPDGQKLAFVARNEGSVLHVYEMDRASGAVEPYSPAPFQFISALAYRANGTLVVNGLPGTDPFDTLRIDQANGFQRVFLLERNETPDPAPFAAMGAGNLKLRGQHDGQLLLQARYNSPSGVADIRLALMASDLSSYEFIEPPDMNGRTFNGAAIASQSGLIATRGVDLNDETELLAIQRFGNALISELVSQAPPFAMVV